MGTSMVKVREGPEGGPPAGRGCCFWREEEGFRPMVVVVSVNVNDDVWGLVVVVVVDEFWSALRNERGSCKWMKSCVSDFEVFEGRRGLLDH